MADARVVRQPATRPRPTAASPNAVSWAYRWLFGTTLFSRKSLKKAIGLPSAYLATRIGITCSHRSDAVGTGRKPQAKVTLSLVKMAFANHAPTAMRNTASQRSGERIAEPVPTRSSISASLAYARPGATIYAARPAYGTERWCSPAAGGAGSPAHPKAPEHAVQPAVPGHRARPILPRAPGGAPAGG